MRQKRWIEYLKDFHFQLIYHPGKTIVVADALSRKRSEDPHQQVARLWAMTGELVATNLILHPNGYLANFVISNDLIERVKITQVDDKELNSFMEKSTNLKLDNMGIVRFRGRLRVLNDEELRKTILEETHCSKFFIHPGLTKMY